MDKNSDSAYVLPLILVIFIGIAYILLGFMIPPIGDDLGFIGFYTSQDDCWYAFPRQMYRQWLWSNARMADMLNPIGYIFIPDWLQAISNGIIVGFMYFFVIRMSSLYNLKSPFFAVLIIFILTFIMRWDSIWMEYNTFYNYIWSSSFALISLSYLFSEYSQSGKWYWWFILPFCFISSAMHEGIGVPLAFSLLLFIWLTPFYKEGSNLRRLSIIAMVLGGFFTMSSPGCYRRVGSMLQPESPLQMIFGSAGFVVILILMVIYLYLNRRSLLMSLIHSKWIVFAGISVMSSGLMLLSGYGGRTGWFAQIFGIIAICQILKELGVSVGRKIGLICSIIMSFLVVWHICMVVLWQNKLSEETKEVIAEYKKSSDGIIYFDYIQDSELPWYLLRKNHGVPDDDDDYYRYCMRSYYGDGKQLVILPTSFRQIPDTILQPIKSGTFILTSNLPAEVYGDSIVARFPRKITYIEGNEYIINSFDYKGRQLYLLSLMDRDRGEK